MTAICVKYSGRRWRDMATLAARLGVDASTVSRAVRRHGTDLDAAGWTPEPAPPSRRPVRYQGRTWESMAELARALCVAESTVFRAVQRKGADLDAAGWTPAPRVPRESIRYQGRTWPSVTALARHLGRGRSAIYRAIQAHGQDLDAAGWTLSSWGGPGRGGGTPVSIRAGGQAWPSIAAACHGLRVARSTMMGFLRRYGQDLDAVAPERPWPWDCPRYDGRRWSVAALARTFRAKTAEIRDILDTYGMDLDAAKIFINPAMGAGDSLEVIQCDFL